MAIPGKEPERQPLVLDSATRGLYDSAIGKLAPGYRPPPGKEEEALKAVDQIVRFRREYWARLLPEQRTQKGAETFRESTSTLLMRRLEEIYELHPSSSLDSSPVPDYLPPGSEPSGASAAPEPPPAPPTAGSPYTPIGQAWGSGALGPGDSAEPPAPPVVIPLNPRSRFKLKNPFRRQTTAKPKKERVTYVFESHRGANVYYGSDGSAVLIPDSGAAQYLSMGTGLLTPLKRGRVMRGRFYGSKEQVEAVVEHLMDNSLEIDAGAKATIARLKGKVPMDFKTNWLGNRVIFYGGKEDLKTVAEVAGKERDALWNLDVLARNITGLGKSTHGPPPAEPVWPPMAPPPAPPMAPPPVRERPYPPMAPPPVRVPPAARDLGLGEEEFSGPAPPPWFTPELSLGPPEESLLGADPRLNDLSPPPAPLPEPPAPAPLPPLPRIVRDLGRGENVPLPPPPAPPRRNGGTPAEAPPEDKDPFSFQE